MHRTHLEEHLREVGSPAAACNLQPHPILQNSLKDISAPHYLVDHNPSHRQQQQQ